MQSEFMSAYFSYIGQTEAPVIFHRWAATLAVASVLEKRVWLPHGHRIIYPNLYVMLMGSPGTRKSTAINIAKNLVRKAGYSNIAANKTTKEKFIQDLAEQTEKIDPADLLDFLDGKLDNKIASMLIGADEFNDFTGAGNLEFYSILGSLWDITTDFEYRIKGGKDVIAKNPAVSLLSGNTPTGFAAAFPPEIIGQGFFSRLLLVHGASTGIKIAFPEEPTLESENLIVSKLTRIKNRTVGELKYSAKAKELLTDIYEDSPSSVDPRFESYFTRRFTHLLKLCIVIAAMEESSKLESTHVLYANTLLSHTEHLMPKALGEFGKAKNSDVLQKIMTALENAKQPLDLKTIWTFVSNDLDEMSQLGKLMQSLNNADKIQSVEFSGHIGFLPKKQIRSRSTDKYVDYSLLSIEERIDAGLQ